jgi:hypothetical protein
MSTKISDMLGRTFTSVVATEDELVFKDDLGTFTFYHQQDCCEHVYIESIVGDLNDLVGEPLLLAEESSSESTTSEEEYFSDTSTWTFYKFATKKGYVDVRWLGESNGYYSESVDLAYEPTVPSGQTGSK